MAAATDRRTTPTATGRSHDRRSLRAALRLAVERLGEGREEEHAEPRLDADDGHREHAHDDEHGDARERGLPSGDEARDDEAADAVQEDETVEPPDAHRIELGAADDAVAAVDELEDVLDEAADAVRVHRAGEDAADGRGERERSSRKAARTQRARAASRIMTPTCTPTTSHPTV